jgi:hypothetical protein
MICARNVVRLRRIDPDNGQGRSQRNQRGEFMRSLLISTAVAVAVLGAAAPALAATSGGNPSVQAATSGVTPVAHRQQHYLNGRVPPYLRGFDDPGYAYHGNINGCAEDLGYGRWESCDY